MVCLGAASAFGGVITSTTTAVGTSYTAVIGNNNVLASDLTNSFVLVNFSDGSQANCTFGNGTGACFNFGNFSLTVTPFNGQTSSDTWTIFNQKAPGTWITTMDINVLVGTQPIGFDNGSIVGITSGIGAGTSPASAAALLQDAIHLSGQPTSPAPEYARLILTFTTAAGSRLDGFQTFGFGAANHNITSFTPDPISAPEPATYALVGLAFAGFGMLKFKRRRFRRVVVYF